MIKRRFKFFTILFILLGFITLSSCGNKVNSSEKVDENATEKQKYVVELNIDNYKKYIDVRTTPYGDGYLIYYFDGTLSYAYYDNVIITYNRSSYGSYDNGINIGLSTGGYAKWYESRQTSCTVIDVTGKVIYWI